MADVSDQAIAEGAFSSRGCSNGSLLPCQLTAYNDVRDDKTETNWLLVDYETERSDKLKLTGTGSGGLAELQNSLQDSNASFAYVRVKYSNDKESVREKFILVVRGFSRFLSRCADLKIFFCLVQWRLCRPSCFARCTVLYGFYVDHTTSNPTFCTLRHRIT